MKTKKPFFTAGIIFLISVLSLSGCAFNLYKQSPRSKNKIKQLEAKVDELEKLRASERGQFSSLKDKLSRNLRDQIKDDQISLEMSEGGLVITLSDNILFDSGKAELKKNADSVLSKVTRIIKNEVPSKNIGIRGHTDNVPIKHSNWKSNWELSTARATSVLHSMKKHGVSPERLSATGYGEFRPVASNDTAKGRSRNRRVEIVVLPEYSEGTFYKQTNDFK